MHHQYKRYSLGRPILRLMVLQVLLTLIILFFIQTFAKAQKINGVAFSAPYDQILDDSMFEDIKSTHANWVALVPEATLDRTTLMLLPDEFNDCWGETIEATEQSIILARKSGFQIFLKPHLVVGDKEKNTKDKTKGATWRGDIRPRSEEDWKTLEKSYSHYILQLAHLAEQYDVELFAVGTELKSMVSHNPSFWYQLISAIRECYSGELTYCANWDEYANIDFWDQLDFIGIDSYFPISYKKTPSVRDALKKWKPIKKKIKKLSAQTQRKILFTEYGYRNVSYAGRKPWIHDRGEKQELNYAAQANLHQALFKTFWDQDWVAGGFAWKWFAIPLKEGNTDFTVQDKPALSVIQKWYGK